LAACPIFVLLFYLAVPGPGFDGLVEGVDPVMLSVALGLLFIQEISDIVDGAVARRRGVVTDFGKLLDPLADTLGHMGTFLCLMWVGVVPLWLLVILYYREAVIGTLRIIAAKRGIVIAARTSGKLKSICLGGGSVLLIAMIIVSHYLPSFPLPLIAMVFSWIIATVAVVSGLDYTLAIHRTVKEAETLTK